MTNNNTVIKPDYHFCTPIYILQKPEWLSSVIKLTDAYIESAYEEKKIELEKKRILLNNQDYEKIKDYGMSYQKSLLLSDPKLQEIQSFIGQTSADLLNNWGYNMEHYTVFFNDFWVQEFSKNGGGHHSTHVHWNNHISGFYFLKCSEKTSYPIFHDPRHGAMMTKLPQKDMSKINIMSDAVNYKPIPGTLMFFPSYVPHEFVFDDGIEPFRFIHFNLQAIKNRYV